MGHKNDLKRVYVV